jgi:very-short-patch-repair endonuclease
MQSKQANDIYTMLVDLFPHGTILKEHYVKYAGQQLFFDFFLKDYNILVEVQGRQHTEYVNHFHGDKEGFLESKKRDNLKKAYCEDQNLSLVLINYDEVIDTPDKMLEKINSALEE